MNKKLTFRETGPEQLIHEVAMPLIAVRGGREEFVSGTAFVIGRGWAITAWHVLDDFLSRYDRARDVFGNFVPSFELLALLILDAGTRGLPLRILRVWRAAPLDLAVLALGVPSDWPDNHVWKVPALDLLPPKVGTPIVAFGFAESTATRTPDSPHATVALKPKTATGEVIEIHHEIRDSGRLPFPCFRTNARFDGGMSGGPVINNLTGKVCGAICSSLPATREDEDHVSYASSLWPVVATQIDATATSVTGADPYPLMDLFSSGTLQASGVDRVRVSRDPAGKITAEASYSRATWDAPESVD